MTVTHENSYEFMVYPNPSDGHLTIHFPANNSSGVCRIYDSTGKLVSEHKILDGPLEMKTDINPSGLYLVSFYSDDNFIYHKKIISR